MLQWIIRTPYLGNNLKGALDSNVQHAQRNRPPSLRATRSFFVQLSNSTDDLFQGCCNKQHERVLILQEMHFIKLHRDQWDLYVDFDGVVSRKTGLGRATKTFEFKCINFALVPQAEDSVIQDCRNWPTWEYLGPCHASILRMELEEKITEYLGENFGLNKTGPEHHWHLQVFSMGTIRDNGEWPWSMLAKLRRANQGLEGLPPNKGDETKPRLRIRDLSDSATSQRTQYHHQHQSVETEPEASTALSDNTKGNERSKKNSMSRSKTQKRQAFYNATNIGGANAANNSKANRSGTCSGRRVQSNRKQRETAAQNVNDLSKNKSVDWKSILWKGDDKSDAAS